jgi:hypothetical protein
MIARRGGKDCGVGAAESGVRRSHAGMGHAGRPHYGLTPNPWSSNARQQWFLTKLNSRGVLNTGIRGAGVRVQDHASGRMCGGQSWGTRSLFTPKEVLEGQMVGYSNILMGWWWSWGSREQWWR